MSVLALSAGPGRRRFLLRFHWFLPARHQRDDDLPRTRLWRLDIRFIWFFGHFFPPLGSHTLLLRQG
jgi:hypothetical protein